MKLTLELPRVGRPALATATGLASTAATLWIFAAAQLSTPSAMVLHVLVGLSCPFGAAWVTLLLIERRLRHGWTDEHPDLATAAGERLAPKPKAATR